jgi:hypothetical protein
MAGTSVEQSKCTVSIEQSFSPLWMDSKDHAGVALMHSYMHSLFAYMHTPQSMTRPAVFVVQLPHQQLSTHTPAELPCARGLLANLRRCVLWEARSHMIRCVQVLPRTRSRARAGRKHEGLQEAIANLQLELDRHVAAHDALSGHAERLRADNAALEGQLEGLSHVQASFQPRMERIESLLHAAYDAALEHRKISASSTLKRARIAMRCSDHADCRRQRTRCARRSRSCSRSSTTRRRSSQTMATSGAPSMRLL